MAEPTYQGLQYIPTPAQAQQLQGQGYKLINVNGALYYDPSQLQAANYNAIHVQTIPEAEALQAAGFPTSQVGSALYFHPTQGSVGGVAADTGIGAAPTPAMTSTQQSAWLDLQQLLQEYGFSGASLTQLVNWAKQEVINGSSENQITLDLMQTPQFKQRFPAIGVLSQQGIAITPADYINMEQSYAQAEQQAGLPANFASYDALIASQVSPAEYSARINQGYLAVAMAPPQVIQTMQDYYGVTPGQLAGYFLNPKASEPQLLQQATAAQIGGAAAMPGSFGQITEANARQLAQEGVTYGQAQTGFEKLAEQRQLENPLPGQQQAVPFTQNQLLQEQFGSNGQTQLQLQIQADLEKNFFNQGTQVGQSQTGLTGAGVNQR